MIRQIVKAGIGLVWTALLVAGAYAQERADPVREPGVPLENFDVGTIGPVLTEMGYLWEQRRSPDGSSFILANAKGETVFVLSPLACRGSNGTTNCLGLQLVAVFDDQVNSSALQDFNGRYAFAQLAQNRRGNAYLSRYDIADYGMARGNVAIIIDTFASLAKIYQDTVSSTTASISDSGARATAANVEIIAGADRAEARTYLAGHANAGRSLEAAQNLRKIFADQALPTNKVKNLGQ